MPSAKGQVYPLCWKPSHSSSKAARSKRHKAFSVEVAAGSTQKMRQAKELKAFFG
jgi:hypothetical protein